MTTIQVLGTGCKKCAQLKQNAELAIAELGIPATVVKVEDINEILSYGVMTTPALAIDGQVKLVGKTAGPEEIKQLISECSRASV